MSTTFLISFISYSFVAVVSIVFGLIYLIKNQFMPYHSEALGLSWSDLDPKKQVLILALMRAVGGGFLATGLTMLILLIIPYRAGDTWSIYAIPTISFCNSSGALYATFLVKNRTPGNPPLGLSLLALGLTIIGFIFSLI